MTMRPKQSLLHTIGPGILNSYAAIFFAQHRGLGVWLIATSLLSPQIGLGGLAGAIVANVAAALLRLDSNLQRKGVWGFNAVFLGMGMGAVFAPTWVNLVVLVFAALITLFVTVLTAGVLGKMRLPFLSLPFLVAIWLVLLASRQLPQMTVSEDHLFSLNALYRLLGQSGAETWLALDAIHLPGDFDVYLRSLGTIFFQSNLVVGVLLAIGLIAWSRAAFVLSVTGFYSAYLFYMLIGADLSHLNQGYLGFNFMLTAIALGGYFVIPSRMSYLLVVVFTPVGVLLTLAMQSVLGVWTLPIFSLPFTVSVMLVLFALRSTFNLRGLTFTLHQYHQPERNHYRHIQAAERYRDAWRLPLQLPVLGEWFVSQGHSGEITHKGAWQYAWDFVLTDLHGKTFHDPGTRPEHYLCYGKPVLAPASGWIEVVVDYIEDNAIGGMDIEHNWGNSIVIRHADGFYSQLSHLKPGSILVKAGDYVHKGQTIAAVGNSGRSPEPHLHWQLQTLPLVGAQTLDYPVGAYLVRHGKTHKLHRFARPEVATRVSNPLQDSLLHAAFGWLPGTRLSFVCSGTRLPSGAKEGEIISFSCHTNAYNQTYLYCENTGDVAYFTQDGSVFIFTEYYGKKGSLLWHLYSACYQVLQSYEQGLEIQDVYPPDHLIFNPLLWLQDLTLPVGQWLQTTYRLRYGRQQGSLNSRTIHLAASMAMQVGSKNFQQQEYHLEIAQNHIRRIACLRAGKQEWEAVWHTN